jgi:cell wall assembly regulator SMI1
MPTTGPETNKELFKAVKDGNVSNIGIAPAFWHKGWIPFASNGAGDYYCLDLAPVEEGDIGQIISFNHENGEMVGGPFTADVAFGSHPRIAGWPAEL